MVTLSQGQRIPVSSLTPSQQLSVEFRLQASLVIDFACFGLDSAGKLSDDRYMVFFNQPCAPGDCVMMKGPGTFSINLDLVPESIEKLVFTAAIDGAGQMNMVSSSEVLISDASLNGAKVTFSGDTFNQERAIMLVEFYRRNGEWRLSPVLQGFDDGLEALVKHFGGEVADAPVEPMISLEKKVEAKAPALLSLAKKAQVSLEKANLTQVKARVGLVLDASGSMNGQYSRGRVQELINRLVPLAVHFDDDGAMDCWAFGSKTQQLSPVTLDNYSNFISTDHDGWRKWQLGPRVNSEISAIEAVTDFYRQSDDETPVYLLFISDGGVHENRKITNAITEAAKQGIFWQFVGMGGHSYGILEKLDTMTGRVVDNCNFFAIDDLHSVSEEELYERMMAEFPQWLKDAKAAGVLA